MESLSILIVEDAEPFADALRSGLTDLGYRVTIAATGDDARARLLERPFDLVITDIIMPDGDGFEVIETTRRLAPAAKIFAMSGGGKLYSAAACLQAAESNGIDAVFLKPFSLASLFGRIEELFPGRGRARVSS